MTDKQLYLALMQAWLITASFLPSGQKVYPLLTAALFLFATVRAS